MITSRMQALVHLEPGAQLLFEPQFPVRYKEHGHFSVDSDGLPLLRVKEQYDHQTAVFAGYATHYIGLFDSKGRVPGVYADTSLGEVVFEDGARHVLRLREFRLLPGAHMTIVGGEPAHYYRIGDLPHAIEFYPGDVVSIKGVVAKEYTWLSDVPHVVEGVSLNQEGVPEYEFRCLEEEIEKIRVLEPRTPPFPFLHNWSTGAENLALVSRGNAWALYNDTSQLKFESEELELDFYTHSGISVSYHAEPHKYDPMRAYEAGQIDFFTYKRLDRPYQHVDHLQTHTLVGYILHECFAEHRSRVRVLTERLYAHQVRETLSA